MHKGSMVRMSPELMEQLLEVKRLSSLPVQSSVERAVKHWLDTAAEPILQKLGATPQQLAHLSQMRLGKPPGHVTSDRKNRRLA